MSIRPAGRSRLAKQSVSIGGHRTSISLEPAFMDELRAIADRENRSLASLIADVDAVREPTVNLSSALRLYVLADLKTRI